jgi:hypothetical protein
MGLALIDRTHATEGERINIFPLPRGGREEPEAKPKLELAQGDRVLLHEPAVILCRFPTLEEREEWTMGSAT